MVICKVICEVEFCESLCVFVILCRVRSIEDDDDENERESEDE